MAEVIVKGDFTVSADKLWDLVSDFGNVRWIQGVTKHELEGEGPGMFRVFYVGDGPAVRERLETVDEARKTVTYTIPEGIPFPVTNYHATMTVSAVGSGCQLEWKCGCEPDGVSEAEVSAIFEGMYATMIGWLKAEVGSD